MNIQEYISSGIAELYVLGLASEEEKREFEQMCAQYPEVLKARTAFELALEKQAMENAIAPPFDIKNKIIAKITSEDRNVPAAPAPVRSINLFKYVAAACVILLAGSIYWNISLSNKNRDLQNNYDNTIARLNESEKDMEVLIGKQSVKMASMKGLDISPSSYATIYWDTATHDVYLLANNLPTPASDKQYQLWAIFNGKPVDLGVFEIKKERLLIQVKNTQGAEAFAITLENKGGSQTPSMDKMYVMGKL